MEHLWRRAVATDGNRGQRWNPPATVHMRSRNPITHHNDLSRWMERLWSLAGATGGNRWQMGRAREPLKQADPQPVATHGYGPRPHGKEGVDGSSPSEGLQNPRSRGFFVQKDLLSVVRAVGMELFMEQSFALGRPRGNR